MKKAEILNKMIDTIASLRNKADQALKQSAELSDWDEQNMLYARYDAFMESIEELLELFKIIKNG